MNNVHEHSKPTRSTSMMKIRICTVRLNRGIPRTPELPQFARLFLDLQLFLSALFSPIVNYNIFVVYIYQFFTIA